jgi:exosortase/archaeosortase family protein
MKSRGKPNKNYLFILLRYLSCLVVSLNSLFLFYLIFTPLTIYPVYFLIKTIFSNAILQDTTIVFNNISIQLVEACIAGSAYFLLFVLNFTTPMPVKKRIKSLLFSFLLLLIINIFRIFIFSILFANRFSLFNLLHMLVWYGLSAIIVFLVWIATIKIYNIKEVPIYTDVRSIIKLIKNKKI